jgi:polyhydroxybutyrate depolymerase
MRKYLFCLVVLIGFCFQCLLAQKDSILVKGTWRTYIVHLPKNYVDNQSYPLVVNMHGLNSNAEQQQFYSQFDEVADTSDFIVVYPDAINGSWALFGNDDVDFITILVDAVKNKFAVNDCLFFTGMSQGGFLSYKLACLVPQKVTAIAVVSGNMSANLQNTCNLNYSLPIMHFHGTSDELVPYNGSLGISSVEKTIDWWVEFNNCMTSPSYSNIANTNINDGSTVERYQYNGNSARQEVAFYKISNGGHTWPGAPIDIPFGNTNKDINASYLIGGFFKKYCSSSVATNDLIQLSIEAMPNPFHSELSIIAPDNANFILYNSYGQIIYEGSKVHNFDFATLLSGIYILNVRHGSNYYNKTLMKL